MLKNEISIQNLKNIQNISCLTSTWVSNSLKGHPFVCNLGLQSFKGTYLATVLQSWFIGVRFFKAEICPGSHSLRGYQWSLKDSGVRVGGRIARGMDALTKHGWTRNCKMMLPVELEVDACRGTSWECSPSPFSSCFEVSGPSLQGWMEVDFMLSPLVEPSVVEVLMVQDSVDEVKMR